MKIKLVQKTQANLKKKSKKFDRPVDLDVTCSRQVTFNLWLIQPSVVRNLSNRTRYNKNKLSHHAFSILKIVHSCNCRAWYKWGVALWAFQAFLLTSERCHWLGVNTFICACITVTISSCHIVLWQKAKYLTTVEDSPHTAGLHVNS